MKTFSILLISLFALFTPYTNITQKLDTKDFRLKKRNEYSGGDCWGVAYKYKQKNKIIGLDSMSCGEYYFYIRKMMIVDNTVKYAWIQHSETRMEELKEGEGRYILTETAIDRSNNVYYERVDTVQEADFSLMTSKWSQRRKNVGHFCDSLGKEYFEALKRKVEEY